ncbi:bifunctional phosphopantothenoylcysteine decarboxylase/phosphopantothenate--cysteine ligase CoaBC [bacterium]|nr:bifunctional phosphopantothenoylcysteine decarboxylase/phosphopantothenate--cysteine ligase CoaBC [bacterium]
MEKRLEKRHILLGITGSIAAYKVCEVLRLLQHQGAEIQVVMTESAQHFITPLTFETLSDHEVITDLFPSHRTVKTRHVSMAEWADCILICPATANIIGKIASGIADDFLSTVVMASRSPVLFAPAMDYQMVRNSIYLSNCEKLEKLGYRFISPEEGELASGAVGPGRLADIRRIIESVKKALLGSDNLKQVRILVTAGPTQEFLDPVRYLTNPSSGKMGYAIAEEASLRGADVTLISGPTDLQTFQNIRLIEIKTAEELARVTKKEWKDHQVLIMAAAVADFRPLKLSRKKIKKETAEWVLQLEQTEDILKSIGEKKGDRIVVGFALETENAERHAIQKLHNKKCDLICLNNPDGPGSGFGQDTNRITLIDAKENVEHLLLMEKWQVAQHILDRVALLLKEKVIA